MSFQQDFLAALWSGKDFHALLEIVRTHHGANAKGREAYEALEQIWRDLGYEESDEDSALRDELEYVMERVWFQGAGAR